MIKPMTADEIRKLIDEAMILAAGEEISWITVYFRLLDKRAKDLIRMENVTSYS